MTWDPTQYQRYADERSRPFYELVDRIPTTDVRRVVDLGCGPGNLTASLAQRWPEATIVGVDNDAAMVTSSASFAADNVSFELGDLASWRTDGDLDVIVANAAFQWVPGHRDLIGSWLAMVRSGGSLAFQVPGNLL